MRRSSTGFRVTACCRQGTSSVSIPAADLPAGAATPPSPTPSVRLAPPVQRLLDVTREALDLAIEQLGTCQPLERGGTADRSSMSSQAAGLTVVEQFVGHGIGREMHEPPQVPNFDSERFAAKATFRSARAWCWPSNRW